MATALITGGSRGLGLALARELAGKGWDLIVDGRDARALAAASASLGGPGGVRALAGDVADPAHRKALIDAASETGRLDVLVNNASLLGPSPQPELASYPLEVLEGVFKVNTFAPIALVQLALPLIQASVGRIVNVTSDAAVEAYEGWGGYGSSKAALEQVTKVLAAEHPQLRVYTVDPGDMHTQMHQAAFPDEDISDRPPPEAAVPGLVQLITGSLPSGRYRAQTLAAVSSS